MILWDLVGTCNLRCPSCPVGNAASSRGRRGLIDDELYNRILEKLDKEFPRRQLYFYNWTEPLIHPSIARYCRQAADRGFHVHLSSNLNHLPDERELMTSGVKTIRVSLSGFNQETYQQGHRGGNIERVKQNMRRLAEAKAQTRSRTRLHVYFHKYRHNLHEQAAMERFSRDLGYEFIAEWAFLMPLERLLSHISGSSSDWQSRFAEDAIVPDPRSAIQLMQPHRSLACELIDQLVLDHRGNVTLCCAVYDANTYHVGSYLDLTWGDLQRVKYRHRGCIDCMSHGAHVLYTHFDKPALHAAMLALAQEQLQKPVTRHSTIPLPVLNGSLARSA